MLFLAGLYIEGFLYALNTGQSFSQILDFFVGKMPSVFYVYTHALI